MTDALRELCERLRTARKFLVDHSAASFDGEPSMYLEAADALESLQADLAKVTAQRNRWDEACQQLKAENATIKAAFDDRVRVIEMQLRDKEVLLADLAKVRAENAELKIDIERHMQIASELATENTLIRVRLGRANSLADVEQHNAQVAESKLAAAERDGRRWRFIRDRLIYSPADPLACGIVAADAETWDSKTDAAMTAGEGL